MSQTSAPAQLVGNAAITDQPSTSMVPDYTATDFSPPEDFIPTTASVPNKFDKNFLQKQQDLINSLGLGQQSSVQAASAAHPVRVISWDPSRPWRGPTRQPTESASTTLYSQGQLWGPNHLSMGGWGWGQQPAHQLIVRQASQRLRLIQAQKHGILSPGALIYRPRLLPLPGSNQTSAQVLQELESKWTASMQASPASRVRLSSDLPDSQASLDGPLQGSQTALVTAEATATNSATQGTSSHNFAPAGARLS